MVFGCNFAEHLGSDATIGVMTRPLLIDSTPRSRTLYSIMST